MAGVCMTLGWCGEIAKSHGSGLVVFRNLTDLVGSGQVRGFSDKSRGSGRVGSGRVGSGRVGSGRVGSGRVWSL